MIAMIPPESSPLSNFRGALLIIPGIIASKKLIYSSLIAATQNLNPIEALKESNKFATLHINEAKYFTGPLVAFSLKDAMFLKQCISNKKIFFIIEPEWATSIHPKSENYESMKMMQYTTLRDIYVDSIDVLCTNNPELKNIIDICWKESFLIPDSECEKLYEHL
jgi:hypothetical protein